MPSRRERAIIHEDVFDALPCGVMVIDVATRRVTAANAACTNVLGYGPGALTDTPLADVWLDGSASFDDVMDGASETGSPLDLPLRRGDGVPGVVPGHAVVVRSDAGDRLCLVLCEATAPQVDLETGDPEQSRRLESIGLLAGGIAHDFNNLLTGVLGQVSLALALLPADSPARAPINKAAGAAERAADMTRQLLAYAGKGQFQLESIDLNAMIIENIGMLETKLPRRARLRLDLDPALPSIAADRGQIQQVLMNLVINAAESIADRSGSVAVKTAVMSLGGDAQPPIVGRDTLPPGEYVCLEVADTGVGMTEETLAQIFDPFFSTKGTGRGLGLSATLGIIRTHRGGLSVESRPNHGTRFSVLFPAFAVAAHEDSPAERDVTRDGRQAQSSSVLVIDDEAAVREVTGDMLQVAGVDAMLAADGPAGIALLEEHGAGIGVVLLDMQMPGMNGEQTYDALRQVDPGVKVVLMSGYSESEATQRFLGKGLLAFLQKPFTYDRLITVVSSALQ